MLAATQDAAMVGRRHLELALSVQAAAVLAFLSFNKLASIIIKVFREITVHRFCPVKDLDKEGAKREEEFMSSEEEMGLGQGEGVNDLADQIDNENMLDGAYLNPEDGQDKEEKDKEGELEDETGDVEGNEDLDKDMWGRKRRRRRTVRSRAKPRRRIRRSLLPRRTRRRAARRRERWSVRTTMARTSSCPSGGTGNRAARNLAVSQVASPSPSSSPPSTPSPSPPQLLMIVSDGQRIFHEGRENVTQAVMKARQV